MFLRRLALLIGICCGTCVLAADGKHERADIHEGSRAYIAEELPKLPSGGRSGSIFDAHL